MSTLVVRDVPEELHASLKAQAKKHHRSVTKEVVSQLEAGMQRQHMVRDLPPPRVPASGHVPGIEEIKAAIADGRYSHYRSQEEVNAWVDELRRDRDVDA